MATGAVIGAALNTGAATAWGLFQAGVNVAKEPGGSGFGVDPADVTIREVGPGNVSSMDYWIDDPLKEITVPEGADVTFWDLTNNVCLFRGWVDGYAYSPSFGGQGRRISVSCTGVEALLDWYFVPAGIRLDNMSNRVSGVMGLIAGQYCGLLRAPAQSSGMASAPFTQNGSFTYPVGSLSRPAGPSVPTFITGLTVTSSGASIRQTCEQIIQSAIWMDNSGNYSSEAVAIFVTVDFYWGLRIWENDAAISLQPDDYTTLTISDTYAGPNRGAGLEARIDWSGATRSVLVSGSGGTVYGPFGDGKGVIGPGNYINDTAITTLDQAAARAEAVIAQARATGRGSFVLEDWTPPTTVHAGSLVSITDAATSTATTYRIMEIEKTFPNSGRQTWKVTFGGLPSHSVARLIRRFTRGTR